MTTPHLFLPRPNQQRGVTLVELMIGLLIGMVIIAAVLYVVLGSRITYKYNDAMNRLQENGRVAVDMIGQDLRMTGFIGCRRLWAYLPAANTGSIGARGINFTSDFEAAIETSIGLPEGTLDLGATGFVFSDDMLSEQIPDRVAGTDSLIVLKGATEIPLSAFMDSEVDDIQTTSTVPAGPAIISDCRFDNLSLSDSSPTGVPAPAEGFLVSAAGTTIEHDGEFQRAYATDASVTPITAVSYSIRQASPARNDSDGNPVLALFRNDTELIEGARGLCVRYGVATNPTNEAVGNFVAAAAVSDWKQVVAIRLELLLASIEDNTVDTPQTGITYCGADFDPDDRRMYRVFSSTIGLRNQIVSY